MPSTTGMGASERIIHRNGIPATLTTETVTTDTTSDWDDATTTEVSVDTQCVLASPSGPDPDRTEAESTVSYDRRIYVPRAILLQHNMFVLRGSESPRPTTIEVDDYAMAGTDTGDDDTDTDTTRTYEVVSWNAGIGVIGLDCSFID